jgi:hypothetical protein
LKTAWFLTHRIREALKDTTSGPLGGDGRIVEVDETFTGPSDWEYSNQTGAWRKKGQSKWKVMTLVERGGKARSIKVESLKVRDIAPILDQHIHKSSVLHTDEAHRYKRIGKRFAGHESVNHSIEEYAKPSEISDSTVTTNTVEGFFSIFKRGMVGVYQRCGEQHLQRYFTEFDFRYNNRAAHGVDDAERTNNAVRGMVGKRLTYKAAGGGA